MIYYVYTCNRQSITHCARQISVCEVLCPTLCLYGCLYGLSFSLLCMHKHVHIYLYMDVIHCWNGYTDMFYNCVIFVTLNWIRDFIYNWYIMGMTINSYTHTHNYLTYSILKQNQRKEERKNSNRKKLKQKTNK